MLETSQIGAIVSAYLDVFPQEQDRLTHLLNLLAHGHNVVDRTSMDGHCTSSAIVFSPQGDVLTIDHKHIKRRLQPGGHLEPDKLPPALSGITAIWQNAQDEVQQETGVAPIRLHPWHTSKSVLIPYDIDTHPIPARPHKGETDHLHTDFLFLAIADDPTIRATKESELETDGVQWMKPEDAMSSNYGTFFHMRDKLRAVIKQYPVL